jgi:hypothetical protein
MSVNVTSVSEYVSRIRLMARPRLQEYGTALHRLYAHRDVGVRSDEDDGHLPVHRDKVALKLKTASPRHSHVEHQATWAVRRVRLEKIGNRREFPDWQADRPQQPPNRVAKLGIIIDDQDTWALVRHPRTLQ